MEVAVENIIERQFEVGTHPKLAISNVSGSISVRAEDRTTIHVRATKHGSLRAMENTHVEFTHHGNRVSVQTTTNATGLLTFARNLCAVDYEVLVPFSCEVRVHAVSADVDVQETRAPLRVQTVSGDVTVADVCGNCTITTVSGDITGSKIAGELVLRTTSGDATIRASHLQSFNLNSVSGDFTVETPLIMGKYYLAKTVSGDLRILVPAATAATIQMKSISGSAHIDEALQAEVIKAGRRNWQGRINGGGANVEISSVSGDLRVALSAGSAPMPTSAEATAYTAPTEAPRGPEDDETIAILQQLERGEISVEEAMARLDALGEQ